MITSMPELVRSFPTIADAKGLAPWDVDQFLRWALLEHRGGSGAAHAIRFVLCVQNPRTDWPGYVLQETAASWSDQTIFKTVQELRAKAREDLLYSDPKRQLREADIEKQLRDSVAWIAPFNVVAAFGTWDYRHRGAFRTWAERPFIP